jgi:hypothetical protein
MQTFAPLYGERQRLRESLSPETARKWSPRAKTGPKVLPTIGPSGRLTTKRFGGWRVEDVAAAGDEGCRFLRYLLDHPAGHEIDPAVRRKTEIVLAAAKRAAR